MRFGLFLSNPTPGLVPEPASPQGTRRTDRFESRSHFERVYGRSWSLESTDSRDAGTLRTPSPKERAFPPQRRMLRGLLPIACCTLFLIQDARAIASFEGANTTRNEVKGASVASGNVSSLGIEGRGTKDSIGSIVEDPPSDELKREAGFSRDGKARRDREGAQRRYANSRRRIGEERCYCGRESGRRMRPFDDRKKLAEKSARAEDNGNIEGVERDSYVKSTTVAAIRETASSGSVVFTSTAVKFGNKSVDGEIDADIEKLEKNTYDESTIVDIMSEATSSRNVGFTDTVTFRNESRGKKNDVVIDASAGNNRVESTIAETISETTPSRNMDLASTTKLFSTTLKPILRTTRTNLEASAMNTNVPNSPKTSETLFATTKLDAGSLSSRGKTARRIAKDSAVRSTTTQKIKRLATLKARRDMLDAEVPRSKIRGRKARRGKCKKRKKTLRRVKSTSREDLGDGERVAIERARPDAGGQLEDTAEEPARGRGRKGARRRPGYAIDAPTSRPGLCAPSHPRATGPRLAVTRIREERRSFLGAELIDPRSLAHPARGSFAPGRRRVRPVESVSWPGREPSHPV
ncbi:hypothetical protein KM043_008665 [Ampulex compressa]|nr:hypothetical protein KM043_008665 [Ampulex compressa]